VLVDHEAADKLEHDLSLPQAETEKERENDITNNTGYPYGQPPQRIGSQRIQGFRNPAMARWNALGERIPKPCSDRFSFERDTFGRGQLGSRPCNVDHRIVTQHTIPLFLSEHGI